MRHNDFIRILKKFKNKIAQEKQYKRDLYNYQSCIKNKSYCKCRDSEGMYKYLYSSYKDIEYLLASKDIKLQSYACPYEKGWHLSKA